MQATTRLATDLERSVTATAKVMYDSDVTEVRKLLAAARTQEAADKAAVQPLIEELQRLVDDIRAAAQNERDQEELVRAAGLRRRAEQAIVHITPAPLRRRRTPSAGQAQAAAEPDSPRHFD
jgi:ATPase subunit of ABC transporter with duplicated ATPase domains